ncbi:ZNF554 [Branchiostoma lanceolatum]|uniref:ZNF554 protein n=1 Tax=Branchiostoma lanceolatum TaxID=7740 RepID=A0A8J9ZAV6_BRALA|nr:ZNF554 [Branchiostoma lanceolatum]
MQMSSPVTSSVPLREENSLNNVVPNHVNNGDICLESVSNDFLVEAEQLGYKTRLRWNTIIQTGLQGEMEVNDRKDTSTVESDLMSGRENHESKKALPLKESESKTFTKRKQRIGTTSSDGQLSNVGKRKQSGPVHGPSVKSKKKKVWPLEESEPKTCKKGAQKAGRTSSRRKPSNGGKSKQPSSLHGSARTTKKKVLPLKESEPKTPTKRKQNEGISSSSGEPSNDINSRHPSPMHDPSLKYRKTRIWPPQESETKSSPKRKVGTTSYSGQPSNDETNKQPGVKSEETPERQIRRRNRKKHVYVCEECGYRTRGKSTMIIHIRTHTGEKPFGCCLCSHRTTSEKNLRHHMQKRHTGLEKPYVCEYCGYTTGTKSALVKHIRIHTGEKPYACEICGYRTTCTSRMKDHMRTHTNERTHRCGQCTYRANRRDSLVRHYLTHTGDKPYHCKQCDYKSTQNCTLKRHVALMHEKRKSLQNKEKANHSDIKEEKCH